MRRSWRLVPLPWLRLAVARSPSASSTPSVTTSTVIDWQTVPAGTYTITRSGAIGIIIVTDAATACPASCNCGAITGHASKFFQCATDPDCEHCRATWTTATEAPWTTWPTSTITVPTSTAT